MQNHVTFFQRKNETEEIRLERMQSDRICRVEQLFSNRAFVVDDESTNIERTEIQMNDSLDTSSDNKAKIQAKIATKNENEEPGSDLEDGDEDTDDSFIKKLGTFILVWRGKILKFLKYVILKIDSKIFFLEHF